MTATVLTFTRDWQGPARESDTWDAPVSGRYPEPEAHPGGLARGLMFAIPLGVMFWGGFWLAILAAQAWGRI